MKQLLIPAALLAAAWALIIPGCTKEYVEDINGVCFERDVLPIFVSNCTTSGCHNSVDKAEGYDLSSYETIISKGIEPGDYKSSEIYQVLVASFGDEAMPPSPYDRLSDEQIATIALWIEEGAEKTTCDAGACDTLNLSFSADIQPILDNSCTGCHSGAAPSGEVNLGTYAGVKAVADDTRLLGSIDHLPGYSRMPQGGNKLSACNIAKISAWINAGAPNN
jgi:mono/diheme cytochrome c family protein